MPADAVEPAEVLLGTHAEPDRPLFGPLPGRRLGDVLAYEMQAPPHYRPWPGRSPVERKYALLDVGVSFGNPCWSRVEHADGTVVVRPTDQQDGWYVDLVSVERDPHGRFVLRDLYVDVMVTDGRVPRTLDLDELADACSSGAITVDQLTDGLRRWQRFLDRYVHSSRFPQRRLTDFPPAAIRPLAGLDGLFGPPVSWPG